MKPWAMLHFASNCFAALSWVAPSIPKRLLNQKSRSLFIWPLCYAEHIPIYFGIHRLEMPSLWKIQIWENETTTQFEGQIQNIYKKHL